MLSAILVGAGVALLVIAAAAWPAALLIRHSDDTIACLRKSIDARLDRIRELEAQVDSLHRQGLAVTSAPVDVPATPAAPALPRQLEAWLEGFEDPDARLEVRAELEKAIAADPQRPVEEILAQFTAL